jgi:hypothetical protein
MGLPDSPVNCLAALAEERPCCLILDQLDAIRWTAVHSASALDVCKELIGQIIMLRKLGKKISVILSCRTFDLQHDPQIRTWLDNAINSSQWTQIEVQLLSENLVREITGTTFDILTKRQREVLRNPQNLAMWIEINKQGEIQPFKSATELLQKFWDFKTLQLEKYCNISMTDINKVIDVIIDWGEKNGTISAPARIARQVSPKASEALESYGILQEQQNKISFCHQSYLDFFIATRLVAQVFGGGSILSWLGAMERQTLFRREQLRQALSMICDEAPEFFLNSLRAILLSTKVRFHLKHLALEVAGQMDDTNNLAITNYYLQLLDNDYWKPHLLETVFFANQQWVSVLVRQGLMKDWLDSSDPVNLERALHLLGSVVDKMGDVVADILSSFVYKVHEKWPSNILDVIGWQISNDSEKVFELRLQLAQLGFVAPIHGWKASCQNSPERVLRLIEAILSTWSIDDNENPQEGSNLEQLYEQDKKELMGVADQYPLKTWKLFMPHVVRLTSIEVPAYDHRIEKWRRNSLGYNTSLGRIVIDLLIAAGQELADERPEKLLAEVKSIETSDSRIVQQVLVEVFAYLPKQFADIGVRWLLNDSSRLHLGDQETETEWMPAIKLIEALSPLCSLGIFKELECSLTRYISSDDKDLAKRYIGAYFDFWGRPQYNLLPALSPTRRSKVTDDLIIILGRKYSNQSLNHFYRGIGGLIGSKLNINLNRISDRAWLQIISNKKIPIDGNSLSWIQLSPEHVAESSVGQFSSSLSIIAKSYPERFGQLALQFPTDTHPYYISAILDAMMLTQPDKEFSQEIMSSWEPASINTVYAMLDKYLNLDEAHVALNFCRIVRNRASECWSDYMIDKVVDIALHHEGFDSELKHNATIHDIFNTTINCVRGVAIEAITKLLRSHPEIFIRLKPNIEILALDRNPVIATVVVEMLLQVYNFDRNKAVEWFCQTTRNDARVPATYYAVQFFDHAVREYPEQLRPILQTMILSNYSDVATQGASLVTAYNLFYGLFEEAVELCVNGTVHQKMGVIKNATRFLTDRTYAPKCRELLGRLINDRDGAVLGEINDIFRTDILDSPYNMPFLLEYIRSKAFEKGANTFLWYLKEFKDSLIPFAEVILSACAELVSAQRQDIKDYKFWSSGVISELSPLLLRLYEQAQECQPDIAIKCLDAWDILFEHQVGRTRYLTREIEH